MNLNDWFVVGMSAGMGVLGFIFVVGGTIIGYLLLALCAFLFDLAIDAYAAHERKKDQYKNEMPPIRKEA